MRQEILLNEEWFFYRGDLKTQMPYWKGPVYSQSKTERKQAGPAAYRYEDRPDQYISGSGILNHERWERVSIPQDIDAFTQELWSSLDVNNKISLFVRYTDLVTRRTEQRILNKHC